MAISSAAKLVKKNELLKNRGPAVFSEAIAFGRFLLPWPPQSRLRE